MAVKGSQALTHGGANGEMAVQKGLKRIGANSAKSPIAGRILRINLLHDPILTPNDTRYRYAIYFRVSRDLERMEGRSGPLS